jgi:hypothetical protein
MADRLCREPTRPVQFQALHRRAALIGSWFADFIRASGHVSWLHERAEYMTAPNQYGHQNKFLARRGTSIHEN